MDISDVYQKKIEAMDAHVSQFYEWLPWTSGELDDVPDDPEERKAWLATRRARALTPEIRTALAKWYGPARAETATHAEVFQICEYGRQPDDDADDFDDFDDFIRQLFPMLPRQR